MRVESKITIESLVIPEQQPKECAFCDIRDERNEAGIIENEGVSMTIISLEGHPIVIPKRHITDPSELSEKEILEVFGKATQLIPLVQTVYNASGANVVMNVGFSAGQRVDHLHTHIIPRVPGDKKIRFRDQEMINFEERVAKAEEIATLLKQLP